jgi:hypothetical protein
MAEISYRRHRFPPVIIQHAVWLYLRFTLSYRDVEVHCGTGIWPSRDVVAGRRDVAGLSLSLPTAPRPMARTPARKAGVLDRGARLPVRDELSAGGEWIRTIGSAREGLWFVPPAVASNPLLICAQLLGLLPIELVDAPTVHLWIEHFQGSAADVDLIVMGEVGEAFEHAS